MINTSAAYSTAYPIQHMATTSASAAFYQNVLDRPQRYDPIGGSQVAVL